MSEAGVIRVGQNPRHGDKLWDSRGMDLAYCRVSTTAQDLDRQIDAVRDAEVAEKHICVDKRKPARTWTAKA
ncbi:recombinase family protein [Streptomyces sp. NPDC096033]|uniref:recombinase family protein n=1 Tax=Streptomyces sp. NPDC096033 TaxID=3366071 RepID=UPI00381BFE6B